MFIDSNAHPPIHNTDEELASIMRLNFALKICMEREYEPREVYARAEKLHPLSLTKLPASREASSIKKLTLLSIRA